MGLLDSKVTKLSHRLTYGGSGREVCSCWVCQSEMSDFSAFCHECNTIQPPHTMDHFSRLGLDCRFDLHQSELEARYQSLLRVFSSEQMRAIGVRQQQLAMDHLNAIEEAYETLKDPVRRAEYLLQLIDDPELSVLIEAESNDLDVMTRQVELAGSGMGIDRVASQAGRDIEASLYDLAQAFRQEDFRTVAVILARLTRLDTIMAQARSQRADA